MISIRGKSGTSKEILILSLLSLTLFTSEGIAGQSTEKLLYEKNSLYQYIRVIENTERNERYLLNSKRSEIQGGIYVKEPEKLYGEYTRMAFISLAFLDRKPEDVLFVGLGAGAMPRYFSKYYPKVKVDVVEIDPEILKIAKEFFYFRKSENMNVHISDGRVFIKRTRKKYDLIFLDAYQSGSIPFHLTTVEFLREVKGKLKDGGIVVSNILSKNRNRFFYSMIKTYKEEFVHLYCYKGKLSDNYIFIAATGGPKMESINVWMKANDLMMMKKFDIDLPWINQESYGYYTDYEMDASVLTDDFAPVNLLKYMEAK
jgi:spermidine synthase